MQRTLLFKLIITLVLFIFSSNGQPCPCNTIGNILQCTVNATSSTVNTTGCSSNGYSSINIIYSGNTVLSLTTLLTNPTVIMPVNESDSHTLQISTINTMATSIEIQIRLSSNQVSLPLFTTSNYNIPQTSTLSINVIQTISNADGFQVFGDSCSSTMNFANYEVIFNNSMSNSGILSFPDLIRGLKNVLSITISGNNHYLAVNGSQMLVSRNVSRLSLKNLFLNDQILYNFINLKEYDIEGCEYNKTGQFLNFDQKYNISLIMKNNNPLDLVLPNSISAFTGLGTLISLTLIEQKLNSSCLQKIGTPTPITIILELGFYKESDFDEWIDTMPLVWYFTINNISTLDIFPSKFFNKIDSIQQVTLQGTFELEKDDICAFVGINIQPNAKPPIIILNSSDTDPNDWDQCADTYIRAINQLSTSNVFCPPNNAAKDCERWAIAAQQCDLISYENACPGDTHIIPNGENFFYNGSYLYEYFQKLLSLNQTTSNPGSFTPGPYIPKDDGVNIGAIIGAVCGLLIAILILGITIFCIYRYRQKDSTKNILPKPEEKYIPSSYDSGHVSIATSKTSQSSRYAIQQSFFPPMQPNDEIAPPLYTAPSESVGNTSTYNLPSAPPAPRDSIATRTTHVYETLDP